MSKFGQRHRLDAFRSLRHCGNVTAVATLGTALRAKPLLAALGQEHIGRRPETGLPEAQCHADTWASAALLVPTFTRFSVGSLPCIARMERPNWMTEYPNLVTRFSSATLSDLI